MAAALVNPAITGTDIKSIINPEKKTVISVNRTKISRFDYMGHSDS